MSPRRCLALALFLATTGTAVADHVVIPGPRQPPPPPPPPPVPVIAVDPPPPPLPPPPPRVIATDPPPPVVQPVVAPEPAPRPPMMWLLQPVGRLDRGSLPELGALELALPLDRHARWDRQRFEMHGAVGAGYGRIGERSGTSSQLVAALGWRDRKNIVVGARSEVTAFDDAIARGHHTVLVHADNFDDDGPTGGVDIAATAEHGEGRGLAPVHLGVGRRDTADVKAAGYLALDTGGGDGVWALGVHGELGATRWHGAPVASAARRGVGLSFGASPADGELPRGRFDVLRGRIADSTIAPSPTAAALGGTGGSATGLTIRTSEVSVGLHDFTLHVDRELMGVVDMNLGWAWMESFSPRAAGTDLFRMQLATHLKWWGEEDRTGTVRTVGPRRIGVALSREPGFTADGQRLVGDWRAQVATGFENTRGRFDARGGVSWLSPLAGGTGPAETIVRYGVQLDAAAKLGKGVELAAYHAQWYEPRGMDPFSSTRSWSLESGVLLRLATP